jgi:hypothetical protein
MNRQYRGGWGKVARGGDWSGVGRGLAEGCLKGDWAEVWQGIDRGLAVVGW